jgi:hypothetical protein
LLDQSKVVVEKRREDKRRQEKRREVSHYMIISLALGLGFTCLPCPFLFCSFVIFIIIFLKKKKKNCLRKKDEGTKP